MNDNLIGQTLANRYHISELIGTGGMASVYKGECNLLNRDVAIKVLRDSVKDDPAALQSFTKEAQASAKLSHNNIVSVFDVGEEDGIEYIVMEYVKGITLKKYIQEKGALPWQEACDYGIQIAQALDVAHSKGVIHRDIKPQNILMTEENELKVTDFGIAKAAAADTLIAGGGAMGSVHYISPEQARGGYTDERSDMYSLGVVLFEMLTGVVPFDGESAVSVALMHIEKEVPSVLNLNPSVPKDLARVVAKAVSKEQASRYQNAQEFINDLRSVLSSQPISNNVRDVDLGETKIFEIPEETNEVIEKKEKTKKVKTPEQKKADKKATVLALLTVLLLFVIGFGAYTYLRKGAGMVKVPDFKNMLLEDAVKLAAEKNLTISDELEYALSDEVEEGKIISQTPEAKSYINASEPISVVVSIGSSGGDISVPYVNGIAVEEAIEKILNAGLTYILNEEPSTTVPQGMIIRQSPEVGTKLNKDDFITLHVSTGPPSTESTEIKNVIVPTLHGKSVADAEAMLNACKLKLVSVSKKNSDAPEGEIISQSPEAGKTTFEGTGVSVVVSNGIISDNVFTAPTIAPQPDTSIPDEGSDASDEEIQTDELKTKTYTFQIPDGEGNANIKINIDGETEYEKTKSYGDAVSIDISGKGKKKIVTFVNGKVMDEQVIDLDK